MIPRSDAEHIAFGQRQNTAISTEDDAVRYGIARRAHKDSFGEGSVFPDFHAWMSSE